MSETPQTAQRLHSIDALRGLAALAVALFHLKVMTSHPGGLIGMGNFLGRWGNGYLWTAVDLFFVISGFIFAHVYLQDGALKPSTTARGYAVARIARIYPLHLLTLLVVVVIAWSGAPLAPTFAPPEVRYDGYHFTLNLLMLQASGIEQSFSFNSPAWSLTSEFVCYALFFVVARLGGRWLIMASVALIGLGVAGELGILPVPSRIARGLVGFFIGVLLYRYYRPLLRVPEPLLVIVAIGAVALVPQLGFLGINAGVVTSFVAAPWLVVLVLHPDNDKLFASKPMQFVGDLSYSTYLLHIPLALIFLTLNGGQLYPFKAFIWLAPAYLGALLLLSWISFKWFETPARKWVRQRLDAKS